MSLLASTSRLFSTPTPLCCRSIWSSSTATSTIAARRTTASARRTQLTASSTSTSTPRRYLSGGAFAATQVRSQPRWVNSKTGEDGEGEGEGGEEGGGGGKDGGKVNPGNRRSESEEVVEEGGESSSPSSSSSSSSSASSTSSSSSSEGSTPPSSASSTPPPSSNSSSSGNQLTKPSIPSSYPYPLLALPIARRPLFPGFYKAVVIRNPDVVQAIKEMMRRGQPYLGAFLLKEKSSSSSSVSESDSSATSTSETSDSDGPSDLESIRTSLSREEEDKDVIESLDDVHDVGVFCQVTSVFAAAAPPSPGKDGQPPNPDAAGKPQDEALTAVLYPHRRIKITELVQAAPAPGAPWPPAGHKPVVHVVEEASKEVQEAVEQSHKDSSPAAATEEPASEVESTTTASAEEAAVAEGAEAMQQDVQEKAQEGEAGASASSSGEGACPPHPNSYQPDDVLPISATPPQTPTSFLANYPISLVRIVNLATEPYAKDNQHIRAFTSEIVSVFKDIAQLNPLFRDQITNFSINQVTSANVFEEPDKLADFAAAVSSGEPIELQSVLEATSIETRLRLALSVLKKELINAQLQSKLSREVDSKIAKRQREYYLMEQLKNIKKELGMESDGKDRLLEKFRERASKLKMPPQVKKVFEEEMTKLSMLESASSEANVTRNYLDWITSLPWGVHTPLPSVSLVESRRILDVDHYGLEQVKERILEFLAVGKLRGISAATTTNTTTTEEGDKKESTSTSDKTSTSSTDKESTSSSEDGEPEHTETKPGTGDGKIICLVGPPGVGKTSVGRSVARCVGRRFGRVSVGGLTDVAEVKGHRRTYVGALPGKIIQTLKRLSTENPLILIDEIDKIGRGVNGDPASALLEMLDPEQNGAFLDHYLDLPVDLSKVLFVCTANTLDTIPAPLLDRMEVLEVSGYVSEEKSVIAQRYLGPQAKEQCGLKDVDVEVTPEAIDVLIKWYARESGVRNLKKYIEKIYRKAALKIVQMTEPSESTSASTSASTTAPSSPSVESTTSANEDSPNPSTSDVLTSELTSHTPTTTKDSQPLKVPKDVHLKITPENLREYVGPPVYQRDRMFGGSERRSGGAKNDKGGVREEVNKEGEKEKGEKEKGEKERKRNRLPPPGVSTGLGYLGNGSGALMPIEAISMPGKGNLQLTGKLGEVIRESAQIALSWVKAHAYRLGLTKDEGDVFGQDRDLHVHMPEGAVGKEGPSAGTALLVAFVSLFKGVRVDSDTALTGEISLSGQVLPVGGLKEKILAAHRAEIKKLLVPEANRADIEENVPQSVKEGIDIVYVENVEEVLDEVFGISLGEEGEGLGREQVNEVKESVSSESGAVVGAEVAPKN
ncbi:ATP-dependent protease La, variant 3 [Coprinopsis cinerea AmutBmut pab1-1]|nr:ATP-dependent protease La, variant 3 [Coprinopsis cinerea AmutBmut pab1-1]